MTDGPRPASTVVLLRDSPGGPLVLLTVRPKRLRFMGGATVFPGGAVAPADFDPRWRKASRLGPREAAQRLDEVDEEAALAYFICAIREAFEEVGFIPGANPAEIARHETDDGEFLARCLELGVVLETDLLTPAGRWVTPHGSPVRFDARFFVARAPEGWEPSPDPSEVEDCRWMTPAGALEELASGQTIMAPPTAAMLQKLEPFKDVESAIASLSGADLQSGDAIYSARLSPMVQIVLAPNPGVMTGPGTNTYVVGSPRAIVIDPAVDDASYIDEVTKAAGDVELILVTHRHSDHVGGVGALAALTGAPVRAWGDEPAGGHGVIPLVDGELIETGDVVLEASYAPGHSSDHVCFWLESERSLFAGDNVLGEGTSVIAPPDGDMRAYLDSLRRLALFAPQRIYPGHFRPLDDGTEVLVRYAQHRREREHKIMAALRSGPATLEQVVTKAYDDTPVELHPVAQMSALAHLLALEADGRVRQLSQAWELAGVE